MAVIYRDRQGVEYESVPLPTNEVTDPVPLDARIVSRRTAKKQVPVYEGTEGVELANQPRHHRRHWTDEQWGAFEEHRRVETDDAKDHPVASAVLVKSERHT